MTMPSWAHTEVLPMVVGCRLTTGGAISSRCMISTMTPRLSLSMSTISLELRMSSSMKTWMRRESLLRACSTTSVSALGLAPGPSRSSSTASCTTFCIMATVSIIFSTGFTSRRWSVWLRSQASRAIAITTKTITTRSMAASYCLVAVRSKYNAACSSPWQPARSMRQLGTGCLTMFSCRFGILPWTRSSPGITARAPSMVARSG
mmetsp:Transcript_29478/g.80920  ORF Transcript_29478/g.80920 Transcript_29478/m.80920 type:complete len:205 (-) Transcript_29478:912-1526(-)